ncbi:hypothetical protein BD289DRAFT_13329 [Coniella lustricola]|uniref:Uncharacterized protein n=1 Tax=Coniella lustricola TaxID=2025994 RepID=A0A2T3A470_9PEZI|nr:hypothetical protein BD289DRAFT_13329 [Coniella lustricola]
MSWMCATHWGERVDGWLHRLQRVGSPFDCFAVCSSARCDCQSKTWTVQKDSYGTFLMLPLGESRFLGVLGALPCWETKFDMQNDPTEMFGLVMVHLIVSDKEMKSLLKDSSRISASSTLILRQVGFDRFERAGIGPPAILMLRMNDARMPTTSRRLASMLKTMLKCTMDSRKRWGGEPLRIRVPKATTQREP